jgi:hypothetical protein
MEQCFIIVLKVHCARESDLLRVAQTRTLACFLTGTSEDGEEDSRENRDDRDHHKQFDQGKSAT